MLDPLLTLLAAKAKVGALVAGTALLTAAAVGGSTVALQSVSDSTPTGSASSSASPSPSVVESPSPEVEESPEVEAPEEERAVAPAGAAPDFTCDPSKNHGQNVSAYVHSLPKGPGRGELVSQVAQSDCGKTVGGDDVNEVEGSESPKPKKPKAAKQRGRSGSAPGRS